MKLLQLNVWMGRLTPQILALIEKEAPDILTLQEVFQADGDIVFPDNIFNCLDLVKQAANANHVFMAPTVTLDVGHHKADFGNAIISKFPIKSRDTLFTHGAYNSDITPHTRIANTRNAQIAEVDINGKKLTIVNHHAHWEPQPNGTEVSKQRMQLIKQRIETLNGPVLFAGDLNLNPRTNALSIFDNLLTDLTDSYSVQSTLSILGKVPDVACDHIFVNKDVQVNDFYVCSELVLDHQALVLDFTI